MKYTTMARSSLCICSQDNFANLEAASKDKDIVQRCLTLRSSKAVQDIVHLTLTVKRPGNCTPCPRLNTLMGIPGARAHPVTLARRCSVQRSLQWPVKLQKHDSLLGWRL